MVKYYYGLAWKIVLWAIWWIFFELCKGTLFGKLSLWLETKTWYKTVLEWIVLNPWAIPVTGLLVLAVMMLSRGILVRRGILRIRGKGQRLLDERIRPECLKYAWHFRVNITNPSPDRHLGIQSITLRSKKRPELLLEPTEGIVGAGIQGDRDKGLVGNFGSVLYLAPSQPIAGTLVFVGESKFFGENWDNGRLFDDGSIVLIDSQRVEYSFPTDNAHITPW